MPQKPYLDRKLALLAVLALAIRLFAGRSALVERYYSQGIYPPIARTLRTLLGWVPFSVGDLLYIVAVVALVANLVRWLRAGRTGGWPRLLLGRVLPGLMRGGLAVYIVFQLLWGLNYSRQGIAHQLNLEPAPYTLTDLQLVADAVQGQLLRTAPLVDTVGRQVLNRVPRLEEEGVAAYTALAGQLPFLCYEAPSVKSSLFSPVGHFVGFTGYYNPFTAEAQIKSDIPVFLKPFVTTHEMAHQLGYAKESEANFVAFLACKEAKSAELQYAAYFELMLYTLADMRRLDSAMATRYRMAAPPRVQHDFAALQQYLERSRNPVEPYMSWLYDAFLRWNNQPKGRRSYNEVLVWAVAYAKKYGVQSI